MISTTPDTIKATRRTRRSCPRRQCGLTKAGHVNVYTRSTTNSWSSSRISAGFLITTLLSILVPE
jgi:hypothetical protein